MSSLKFRSVSVLEPQRPFSEATRQFAASSLRSASAALARLSRRLGRPGVRAPYPEPQLEFYAMLKQVLLKVLFILRASWSAGCRASGVCKETCCAIWSAGHDTLRFNESSRRHALCGPSSESI